MSYVANGSLVVGTIPCVVSGCLAARTPSSSTCSAHRPHRPTRSVKARPHPAPLSPDPLPSGDNCRPRTLRFVRDVELTIRPDIETDRSLSDVELGSALSRFLIAQQTRDVPEHITAAIGQTAKLPAERQHALAKLLSPRPSASTLRHKNILSPDEQRSSKFHERVSSLETQLGARSPRENLVDQHIIIDNTNAIQAKSTVLSQLLSKRPSAERLVSRNILKRSNGDLSRFDPTTSVAPSAASTAIESPRDRLQRMLSSRPAAKSLIAKNILKSMSPAMGDRQRALEMHQRQVSLNALLSTRPTSTQLIEMGIIEETVDENGEEIDDQRDPVQSEEQIPEKIQSEKFVVGPVLLTPDLPSPTRTGDSSTFNHVLFIWGQNHHAQLGLNNTRSQPFPTLCRSLIHIQIRLVAVGSQHSLCLSSDNTLYGWGNTSRGQLGLGDGPDHLIRSPITLHVSHSPLCNQAVKTMAAGSLHSAIVLGHGRGVLVTGAFMNSSMADVKIPSFIPQLQSVAIEQIACGRHFSAAVSQSGDLWTWGRSAEGQLGRGRLDRGGEFVTAGKIETHTEFWASVTCGADHCAAIGFDHCVYVWGDNSLGQLGIQGIAVPGQIDEPRQVKSLSRKGIIQMACSQNHTAALSEDGTIYSTTIISSGSSSNFIRLPPTHCFTGLAAGINQTAGLTTSGTIYIWEMDNGSYQSSPISTLQGIDLTAIVGGYRHLAVLARVPAGTLTAGSSSSSALERGLDGIPEEIPDPEHDQSYDKRRPRRNRNHKRNETIVRIDPEMRSVQQD